jgi:hypothetical protein
MGTWPTILLFDLVSSLAEALKDGRCLAEFGENFSSFISSDAELFLIW